MKIKTIISQHRRDFSAIFECEHCDTTEKINGYDDAYLHSQVIPNMECKKCGKTSPDTYRPLTTKYPEGFQI
jgi:primosomal protein N'